MRRRIPVRGIPIFGSEHRVDVDGWLIGKHELAIDDLDARAERRAAWRVADREKQITARLKDVLERITRFGQAPCRSPMRTVPGRPASFASSTHVAQIYRQRSDLSSSSTLPRTGQSLHRLRLIMRLSDCRYGSRRDRSGSQADGGEGRSECPACVEAALTEPAKMTLISR